MIKLAVTLFLISATSFGLTIKAKDEPIETVKRMAEQGQFDYTHELAYRYERGISGVSQDFNEAVRWYCKNKVTGANTSNRSMLKLEKFAESDPEVKDPTEAIAIYCDKKKAPKPSMEPYSPLRVSWCDVSTRDSLKDCGWFNQKYDKHGKPIGAAAVAEIALSELPALSRSTDWYLDLVWKFGLYGGSISPFTNEKYQTDLIIEDPKQRPHLYLEIKSNYLKPTKTGYLYNEPTYDGSIKLQFIVKNKALKECLDRAGKHYDDTMILGTLEPTANAKIGRQFNVVLVKRCYGDK